MRGRTALLVALVSTASFSVSAAPELEFHRKAACEPAADGWCLARSTKGGFSIELPMPFNDFMLPADTLKTGGKASAHVVGGVYQGTAKLSATCLRYVEGKPDAKAIQENVSSKFGKPEPYERAGLQGQRYRIEEPQRSADAVSIVGADYQCLLVAEVAGEKPLPPETLERFFGSFSLSTPAK
jgi:hypothetical protein